MNFKKKKVIKLRVHIMTNQTAIEEEAYINRATSFVQIERAKEKTETQKLRIERVD